MKYLFYSALLSILISCIPDNRKSDVFFVDKRTFSERRTTMIRPDTPISFEVLKREIIDTKCLKCHVGVDAALDIDLSSYETTMQDRFVPLLIKGKPEKSRFYKSVLSGEMPPKGPKLEPIEIEYISKWIKECAPEFEGDSPSCDDDPDDDDDFGDDDDFFNS